MASKTKTKSKSQPKKKRNAYVVGLVVAIILALLTVVEYYVAILPDLRPDLMQEQSVAGLFLIAFIKAALVVYFFMHVYRLWRPDDHADDHASEGGH